ncbi:MAG: TIGR03016 family PEP-CTERM system-associated outer membrane protein [Parahaliea sp.]
MKRAIPRRALVVISAVTIVPVWAGQWEREAGVSASAIYSDNICMLSENCIDKLVGTLTPRICLKSDSQLNEIDLYAAVQFNTLENSNVNCSATGANTISPAPRIRFSSDSILVNNLLYLETTGFADQNRINAFQAGGDDPINGRGNLNTSYQYSVAPYIARRLTDKTEMLLQYRYSEEFNTENDLYDNQRQEVQFAFGISPERSRFSAGLLGSYSDVEYANRPAGQDSFNSELSSMRVRAAYQMSRAFQINGYAGEEWNDYVTVFQDDDGGFWDIGLTWTPNTRVAIEVGTGESFFGDTPRASVSYRHKHSMVSASYRRELTYSRSLRGSDPFADDIDDLVDDGLPGDQDVMGLGGRDTTFAKSAVLDESLLLSYRYNGRRTSASISGSRSVQTRFEDGYEDQFTYVGLGLKRDFGRRLSVFSRLTWHRREPDGLRIGGIYRKSDLTRITLGVNRDLGNRASVSLSYQYADNQSDNERDDYDENRIILSLDYQF